MPLATSVLSSLLLAQSLPTVFDANADYTDGRLALEIVTSEPIAAEDVRSKLTADALVVYVQGVVVERSRRAFTRPDGRTVNAYPRAEYTKLSVPFDADQTCSGSIDIEVTKNGARASVGCSPRQAGVVGRTVQHEPGNPALTPARRTSSTDGEVARPDPIAARAAFPNPASQTRWTAPPIPGATAPAAPVAIPGNPVQAPAPSAPSAEPAPAPSPAGSAAPSPVLVAVPVNRSPPPQPLRAAAVPEVRTASGGLTGTGPIVVTVLVAAFAIFLFWRRRRQHGVGLIQILESASIGPKRSLVVAQIGGQRLILGASEAGITLLSPLGPGLPQARGDDPLLVTEAAAGLPAEGEKGLLARLFSKRRQEEIYIPDEDGPSTMAEDFRDLLEENVEDAELRRRLQAGVGGRTR